MEKLVRTVKRKLNPKLEIEGIIITKYQGNTNYCKQVYEIIDREFGE
ncbi:MAG: ParA family protein [Clostridiales bacterium]|nr:ParA family protein [Clostridiales bacterium]